jgi:hyaluronan synthase
VLTFILCVLGLRLFLSLAKYAWSICLRIGHPTLASVKQDFSLEPTVSILLPCFNEGPDVYNSIRTILECDYPVDKFQVIATDDCSKDDSWEWLQGEQPWIFPDGSSPGEILRTWGNLAP